MHLLITIIFDIIVLRNLEKYLGWLSTCILYMGSGIGGNVVSGIFVPYSPEVILYCCIDDEDISEIVVICEKYYYKKSDYECIFFNQLIWSTNRIQAYLAIIQLNYIDKHKSMYRGNLLFVRQKCLYSSGKKASSQSECNNDYVNCKVFQ